MELNAHFAPIHPMDYASPTPSEDERGTDFLGNLVYDGANGHQTFPIYSYDLEGGYQVGVAANWRWATC